VSGDVTENVDGVYLVREVTDVVLEGGELHKGTTRLVPVGSKESESSGRDSTSVGALSDDEGQSPTPNAPPSGGELEDGPFGLPVAWANLWTTNHRVEMSV